MSNERKFRCKIRKFLNYDGFHGNATIEAYVERGNKKSGRRPWTMLRISDCDNTVNLTFGSYGRERTNSLYKINTLVESLTKFRDALEYEFTRLESEADDDLD